MPKTALILVDIQNDYFASGDWPVDRMDEAAGNAARLLDHARRNRDAVIHMRHEMASDKAPFFRPGSAGAQIHPVVAPAEDEPVVVKHRPNSFHGTSLHSDLVELGVENMVICGAMSQMCIDATARAAADFGFAVTVVEDACGAKEQSFNGQTASARQVHAAIMAPLAMSYGRVVSTEIYLGG